MGWKGSERQTPCVGGVTYGWIWRAVEWRLCVNRVAGRILSLAIHKVANVWLLGSECVVCSVPARGVCTGCTEKLEPPVVPPLLAIESAVVLCSYEGVGADLIRAVKYGNRRQAITPMVDALVPSLPNDVDAVVSVPSNPVRVRERGYDLTATLANRIGQRIGAPVITPLVRVSGGTQKGKGRDERKNVEFRAAVAVPERVLLVDDVVTTGATAVACAIALGLAGARSTTFVALGATPANSSKLLTSSSHR